MGRRLQIRHLLLIIKWKERKAMMIKDVFSQYWRYKGKYNNKKTNKKKQGEI